ncbi:unnamed protein product [Darwinula stevensoni]|uniref:Apple domain-containing protein n=1 Tax=Darwinula stevensoni TaxID=69355 RepID=A0A7R8XFZ1_9CRUS|nr:unnamed protein product [Darwinula stevensoni]CAG0895536.1 unnamed protein product [Darwinula stevensoni]
MDHPSMLIAFASLHWIASAYEVDLHWYVHKGERYGNVLREEQFFEFPECKAECKKQDGRCHGFNYRESDGTCELLRPGGNRLIPANGFNSYARFACLTEYPKIAKAEETFEGWDGEYPAAEGGVVVFTCPYRFTDGYAKHAAICSCVEPDVWCTTFKLDVQCNPESMNRATCQTEYPTIANAVETFVGWDGEYPAPHAGKVVFTCPSNFTDGFSEHEATCSCSEPDVWCTTFNLDVECKPGVPCQTEYPTIANAVETFVGWDGEYPAPPGGKVIFTCPTTFTDGSSEHEATCSCLNRDYWCTTFAPEEVECKRKDLEARDHGGTITIAMDHPSMLTAFACLHWIASAYEVDLHWYVHKGERYGNVSREEQFFEFPECKAECKKQDGQCHGFNYRESDGTCELLRPGGNRLIPANGFKAYARFSCLTEYPKIAKAVETFEGWDGKYPAAERGVVVFTCPYRFTDGYEKHAAICSCVEPDVWCTTFKLDVECKPE